MEAVGGMRIWPDESVVAQSRGHTRNRKTYKKGTATKKGSPYLHLTVAYAKCDPGYTRQGRDSRISIVSFQLLIRVLGNHTFEFQFGE